MDLRKRVVAAVDQGQSRVSVAKRFQVSNALIGKLLRQRKRTGSIGPLPHGGGKPPALDPSGREALCAEVRRRPDATLAELSKWAGERGVSIGPSGLCRTLQKLKLSLKKK
ncbi:MAG TPA: IS630 transposase-related protein [Myxococcaceae bacterium]|nr:IS630 transposase-related protein [Myxococcaceae bacterium]